MTRPGPASRTTPHCGHGGHPPRRASLVWPADHAWCVAHDVDPHYAGIGGPPDLIAELTTNPHLDAVHTDPATPQPTYH